MVRISQHAGKGDADKAQHAHRGGILDVEKGVKMGVDAVGGGVDKYLSIRCVLELEW